MTKDIAKEATLAGAQFAKQMRQSAGLTQAELAKKLNISQPRVSAIETGVADKNGVTIEILFRIADACNLKVRFITEII